MGRVIVAGNNQAAALLFIRIGIFKEFLVKIKLILQPFIAHLAVRKVDVKKNKIIKIQLNNTSFSIEFDDPQLGIDALGLDPCVSAHTAVAFFHRGMRPAGFITFDIFHFIGQLIFLNLGLLNGKNVRIHLMKQCEKILFNNSPQAVYVPGNEFDPLLFFRHLYIP